MFQSCTSPHDIGWTLWATLQLNTMAMLWVTLQCKRVCRDGWSSLGGLLRPPRHDLSLVKLDIYPAAAAPPPAAMQCTMGICRGTRRTSTLHLPCQSVCIAVEKAHTFACNAGFSDYLLLIVIGIKIKMKMLCAHFLSELLTHVHEDLLYIYLFT